MNKNIFLVFFLLIVPFMLFAKKKDDKISYDKELSSVLVWDISLNNDVADFSDDLVSAVKTELEYSNCKVVDVVSIDNISKSNIGSVKAITSYAKEKEAELVCFFQVFYKEQRLFLQMRLYQVNKEKQLVTYTKVGRINVALYGLIQKMVKDSVTLYRAEIEKKINELAKDEKIEDLSDESVFDKLAKKAETEDSDEDISLVERLVESTITVYCPIDGAKVYLADGREVGIIKDGKCVLSIKPVAFGQILEITVKYPGFYPAVVKEKLDNSEETFTILSLNRKADFGLEFMYNYPRLLGLGLGFRYYPISDTLFLSVQNFLYFISAEQNSSQYVVLDDINFLIGFYPYFPPSSAFRISLSTGPGVIITKPSNMDKPFIDGVWNLAVINFELNLSDVSIFLGTDLKLAFGIGENNLYRLGFYPYEQDLKKVIGSITLGVLWKIPIKDLD